MLWTIRNCTNSHVIERISTGLFALTMHAGCCEKLHGHRIYADHCASHSMYVYLHKNLKNASKNPYLTIAHYCEPYTN